MKVGDTIELIAMPEDPDPIRVGTKGTIKHIGREFQGIRQIDVEWENGRKLMLSVPPDQFKIVRPS